MSNDWAKREGMATSERIKVNQARCGGCGDLIISTHRHDRVTCSCGKTFVDGGKEYLRRGWHDDVGFTELTEYEPQP